MQFQQQIFCEHNAGDMVDCTVEYRYTRITVLQDLFDDLFNRRRLVHSEHVRAGYHCLTCRAFGKVKGIADDLVLPGLDHTTLLSLFHHQAEFLGRMNLRFLQGSNSNQAQNPV